MKKKIENIIYFDIFLSNTPPAISKNSRASVPDHKKQGHKHF
jgi:hypothetical protein